MDLSIVVPVYNEEECIEASRERIHQAIQNSPLCSGKVEIIFINDGSRDKTPALLNSFLTKSSENIHYRALHLSRNFGHSAAVLAGLEHAQGEIVSILDADMQDPPELIPTMVEKISDGYDVVYGVRTEREGESVFKKVSSWLFYRLINLLSSVPIPNDTGDFRVMNRQALEALLKCNDHTPFIRGLVAWIGYRQLALPYKRERRKLGSTKYPLSKMIRFAWQAISSFSNTPLLFIVYLGLFMTLVSTVVGAWALRQYFRGEVIHGWTSLLIGFTAGNAVTLLMLGIMGLYLGKVIDQVRGRPRYLLRK